jgi:hypothetical protein
LRRVGILVEAYPGKGFPGMINKSFTEGFLQYEDGDSGYKKTPATLYIAGAIIILK